MKIFVGFQLYLLLFYSVSVYAQNIPFGFFRTVVSDPCSGNPSPGDICTGGAIHLGSLSPGATSGSGTDKYMTTPGGCTDSATPTCSGTDSLTKKWYGSSGFDADLSGLTNYTATVGTGNGAINTDVNYGSDSTAAIVADASISSDSAADWCNDLDYGGYTDWHLPNRYELNLMFTNKAFLPGLDVSGTWYWSTTEYNNKIAWRQRFSDGTQSNNDKNSTFLVRCVRKYLDSIPGAINWTDFKNTSSSESFVAINQTINVEVSAVYGTGTPTIEYRKNDGSWTAFTPGSPVTVAIARDDTLQYQVTGTDTHSATFTVKNLSDSNTILDTVVGTVGPDSCFGSPTPGDTCSGGAIYLGTLSPGATNGSGTDNYMITPGGCNDFSTSTCSGTDSLTKTWRGSTGSDVDIPGLTNYVSTSGTGNGAINTDANYGSDNTAAIVAHASISSDSAADWCNDLDYGGYTDWYLPNRYELNLMFTNKALLPGLDVSGVWYWSTTQSDFKTAWRQRFSDGNQNDNGKNGTYLVRCVRRFVIPDPTPDAMNWPDFNNTSSSESFAGINQTISVELSAVYGTGSPTIEYRKNGGSWTAFTPGSPATVSIDNTDTLEYQVSGTGTHSATITVTNLSDSNTILDTTVGTVDPDPCAGSPSSGDTCLGGAIYLGSLSPGATGGSGTDRYMTTPGGCNDSSTPTCSGTDSLAKTWNDGNWNWYDIPSLTNYTTTAGTGNGAINNDANYGSANTAAMVAITAAGQGGFHLAARWCDALNYGGYTDWHLPNRYELNLMFINKASISDLDTSGNWYWSSTESSSNNAWRQRFTDGNQSALSKVNGYRIRCVRRY